MKKRLAYFSLAILLSSFCSVPVFAEIIKTDPVADSVQTMTKAKEMLTRLDQINAMNKTGMSQSENRKLRRECRRIKGDLKELDGGFYVPIGSLVVLLFVPLIVFSVSE